MAAIFFDIDGTLLDREHKIEDSTREGIRQARENGHQVFLNSGRTKAYIHDPDLLSMEFDGILCGCGTHVIYHGKDIVYHQLSRELAEKTVDICYRHQLPLIMEGRNWLYMDEDMICRDPYGAWLYRREAPIIRPIRGNSVAWECQKFSAAIRGLDYQEAAEQLSEDYQVLDHDGAAMELVPKGYSKATAIRAVCEAAGIDRTETYSFGDGANDVDMLRYAQYGIAMGNSKTPALQAADYITDDIHAAGVYHALQHFQLI